MHRIRAVVVVSLALLGSLAIVACGSDSGGDEDPQDLLELTFNNDEKVTSGVFDISFDLNVEGGSDAGTFDASLGGPFQTEEGSFPQFDIDAEASADSESEEFSGSAGLTSTGAAAFVNVEDTEYEVPAKLFGRFSEAFTELQQEDDRESAEEGNFLSSIGVDPSNWLTDLENEGTEDVEGTETVHISGTADTPKLVEDIRQIAENAPEAAGRRVTPDELAEIGELTDIIETAEFDIYTGAEDELLRKLEGTLTLNPTDGEDAPESVDLTFAITLSELNEPQQIAGPSSAKPLADLLERYGISPGDLGELGTGLGGGGGGDGLPQAGGSPQAPSSGSSQAYLECLRTAEGEAAVQECSSRLQ